MSDEKAPLSPSKVWSPHGAALHRRRKVGEKSKKSVLGSLGALDLGDEDDDMFMKQATGTSGGGGSAKNSPGKKSGKKSVSSKSGTKMVQSKKAEVDDELRESLEGVSPSVRAKLKKVLDKTTPMKERLELEVQMMKDPDERKILADFKYKFERKNLNMKIFENEVQAQDQLDKSLKEEAKRAKAEQKEFSKRRQERLDEERAKKEREAKLERDVNVHKAKAVAQGAEELRMEAEKTAEAAARNQARKEREAREKEKRIQDFLNGEGKRMTDVERELKLARMLNDGQL